MPQPLPGLQAASETRRAKDKALGYLALRSYGSQELYEKLCMKFDTPSSAAAVAEMQRLGLLDDAAFARARARHLAGQNKSAREIERRLGLLGLGAEDISAAMEEILPQSEAACPCSGGKALPRKAGRRPAGEGAGGAGAAGVFLW